MLVFAFFMFLIMSMVISSKKDQKTELHQQPQVTVDSLTLLHLSRCYQSMFFLFFFISIPFIAPSVSDVRACIFLLLGGRNFWNSLCSILLLLLQQLLWWSILYGWSKTDIFQTPSSAQGHRGSGNNSSGHLCSLLLSVQRQWARSLLRASYAPWQQRDDYKWCKSKDIRDV